MSSVEMRQIGVNGKNVSKWRRVIQTKIGPKAGEWGTGRSREYCIAALNAAVCAGALLGYRGFVRIQESVAAADVAG